MEEPKLRVHSRDRSWWLRDRVLVELWQETLGDAAYLAFYGAVRVDLKQWRHADGPKASTRWYRINGSKAKRAAWADSEDEFSESKPSLDTNALYLKLHMTKPAEAKGARNPVVSASIRSETQPENAPITPSLQPEAFQFVIPNKPMRCSRKLQSIRVGEIVHQVNAAVCSPELIRKLTSAGQGKVEHLRDFLPTTMYSRVSAGKDGNVDALDKALRLLQLSCQYAVHCTEQLDANTRWVMQPGRSIVKDSL